MGPPGKPPIIYSFAHSVHYLEAFLDLLHTHGITTVVDVRQPTLQPMGA